MCAQALGIESIVLYSPIIFKAAGIPPYFPRSQLYWQWCIPLLGVTGKNATLLATFGLGIVKMVFTGASMSIYPLVLGFPFCPCLLRYTTCGPSLVWSSLALYDWHHRDYYYLIYPGSTLRVGHNILVQVGCHPKLMALHILLSWSTWSEFINPRV
jgi:hypothetical protein